MRSDDEVYAVRPLASRATGDVLREAEQRRCPLARETVDRCKRMIRKHVKYALKGQAGRANNDFVVRRPQPLRAICGDFTTSYPANDCEGRPRSSAKRSAKKRPVADCGWAATSSGLPAAMI